MGYFDQWSGTASQAASQYGVPQNIFFGLIDQESSWNPNADAPSSSAYGFTQLLSGTASDLGVNRFNPTQNLFGGAQYLSQMPGSNWIEKLAHYYQGPAAKIGSDGLAYAKGVLDKAKKYMSGDTVSTAIDAGRCIAGDPTGCASAFGDISSAIFGGEDSCGLNPICYLRQWIDESGFFQRLALASLALLFVLGGLYLYKQN